MNSSKTNNILQNINTSLNNIENDNDNIRSDMADIGVSISRLNTRDKIYFSDRLTDGTNDYLERADYASSPIYFSWTNNYDYPVYITDYVFAYRHGSNSEPSSSGTYHSTAFTTKIGKMNDNGDDMDENNSYYTMKTNLEMALDRATQPKRTFNNDNTMWWWRNEFFYAPIKIEPGKKFAHYIAGDFASETTYHTDPVGIIQGYYYE